MHTGIRLQVCKSVMIILSNALLDRKFNNLIEFKCYIYDSPDLRDPVFLKGLNAEEWEYVAKHYLKKENNNE